MPEPLPLTQFTYQFSDVQSEAAPDFVYTAKQANSFEACQEAGIRKGVILLMTNQMNGSPQGVGSKWIITNYRSDLDRITVQPVGSKSGCTAVRNITLACLKDHFLVIGFQGYRPC